MIGIVIALLFICFFLVIPSHILLKVIVRSEEKDPIIWIGFRITLGIVLFIYYFLLLRILGLSLSFLYIFPAVSVFYILYLKFIRNTYLFLDHLRRFNPMSFVLVISVLTICVVAQNIVTIRGGISSEKGLQIPSVHDGLWNVALLNEAYYHFPLENPAMAGEPFKNNHYFYPLFLAGVRFVTGFTNNELYYRFGPLLVSFLFGVGLYSIASLFSSKYSTRAIAIFLGFFSGNMAYILPLFFGKSFDWRGNTFFSDQPFDQLTNPYSVLGFAIFLFIIYSFHSFLVSKHRKYLIGWSLIIGLMAGCLYGIKSFGGILAILTFLITMPLVLVVEKEITLLLPLIFTSIFFIPIFLFTTEPGRAGLVWIPGWLLAEMMSGGEKLNRPEFSQIESYYHLTKNYVGIVKLKTYELFIYIAGNLGTRIIGLLYILFSLIKTKKKEEKVSLLFISIAIFLSLVIPLVTNLKISPYNIIQFTPYALLLLSIFLALFLEQIIGKISHKHLYIASGLIIIIIALSIPVNIKNLQSKLSLDHEIISSNEVSALYYLKNHTTTQDVILLDPENVNHHPIYIPAISERRAYLAGSDFALQTGRDPARRVEGIKKFYSGDIDPGSFLHNQHISYVYVIKSKYSKEQMHVFRTSPLEKFYENDTVLIVKN